MLELPLRVHIVRKADGTGGVKYNDLYDELQRVNELFAPGDIRFFLVSAPHYINDDYYADMFGERMNEIGEEYDQEGVINVYFVPKLSDSGGTTLCGLSRGFVPVVTEQWDKVFVATSCATNGSTLAHELGHYLSLHHTHAAVNGPATVNGTGCQFNGDQICDTPADPMLLGLVNEGCEYVGSMIDPNGEPYSPLTNNVMSYAPADCRSTFTQTQLNRMSFSVVYERSYLHSADTFRMMRLPEYEELPVTLSPNPSDGSAHVTIPVTPDDVSDVVISVYNLRGEEILSSVHGTDVHQRQQKPLQVDLGQLDSGIYLVSVSNGTLSGSQKLIVQ